MRLVILTTDTLHHARFVQQISNRFPIARVFEETTGVSAPFETAHPFENLRDEYEYETWFPCQPASLENFASVSRFEDLNDPDAVAELAAVTADIVLVFGTRRLKPAVLEVAGPNMLNLHGGNPAHYRGLDTHLWAIYHQDFANLVTTLHTVNETLDDGWIVAAQPIVISPGMEMHQLRAANTEVCIQLSMAALEEFADAEKITSREQQDKGRYYSFMPADLKELCLNNFRKHTEKLS